MGNPADSKLAEQLHFNCLPRTCHFDVTGNKNSIVSIFLKVKAEMKIFCLDFIKAYTESKDIRLL